EGYGSIILATPAILPAVAEMFADDIAWLADLGSKETGKWGSDGFAIRQSGDDIYVIGNTSKGAMNGVYDLIEDNLGVLWIRADEENGLIYDELEEAAITKIDYREKSPFAIRGCQFGGDYATGLMMTRNKCNTRFGLGFYTKFGGEPFTAGHTTLELLLTSPLYDPEETEYWETDEAGNCLWQEGSRQINPWSEKAIDAMAASIIATMEANPDIRCMCVGELDNQGHGRNVPYDTEPFEYAPGEFIDPTEYNFYSTVWHTMVNKIARKVRDAVPDGRVSTFVLLCGSEPAACEMEDNVMICYTPVDQDMTVSMLDPSIDDRVTNRASLIHWKYIPQWVEKTSSAIFWVYYLCNYSGTEYSWPIWYTIQEDLQGLAKLGVEGISSDGESDVQSESGWLNLDGPRGNCQNYWDMNELLCWLYQKLLWNPDEDIPSLITYFCDKVYGGASPYMQEYYRLLEQGFNGFKESYKGATTLTFHFSDFYKRCVKNQGIGHPLLDTLEQAYNAASGPVKDRILYIWDCVKFHMSSFRSF
ncbi:MAG: DUF4838 domain-containing protein, partial [Candidatus Methanomethylophilaceae archaeon]|nr:DUF4838 domain-containing protein [Candidatus Methanomethylophilaceae archaeon]